MHDLKFLEAARLRGVKLNLGDKASPACIQVLAIFRNNVQQILGLVVIPAYASFSGAAWQIATNEAVAEVCKGNRSDENIRSHMPEIHRRASHYMGKQMNISPEQQREELTAAATNFCNFAAKSGPSILRPLEGLMISILTQIWSAFEAMAGDLWQAAVDEHPVGLANLCGKRKKGNPSDGDGKSVSLGLLSKHGFQIADKMGSVLREKFNFTRLSGIREAYRCAFGEDFDDIDSALESPFLDALSAVRNVFVHRAGVMDREFVEKASLFKTIPNCPPISEGITIAVDGDFCNALVNPVVDTGCGLIAAVNEWLLKH